MWEKTTNSLQLQIRFTLESYDRISDMTSSDFAEMYGVIIYMNTPLTWMRFLLLHDDDDDDNDHAEVGASNVTIETKANLVMVTEAIESYNETSSIYVHFLFLCVTI